jgi:signal transduction histidine kinase
MKLTIDKKIALFISVLIFALSGILGFFFVRTETLARNRELNERAAQIVADARFHLEYPVLVRDRKAMRNAVREVMSARDVIYCRVEDREGQVLYQEGTKGEGPSRDFTGPLVTKMVREAEALMLDGPGVISEEIGRVTLTFSLSGLNRMIFVMTRTITLGVLTAILLASLGAYLLLRRLIGRPVAILVRATERIAGGDLKHKVALATEDEFEKLGNSFDRMTVSLRTAQEELVQREKLTLLGQLAGSVGNELRNPLGVMTNAVFFLENKLPDADETVKEYLAIIQSEIDGSQRILSDFIDFFRTRTPRPQQVEARKLIEESLARSFSPENITVSVDLPETLPPLYVDPAQIQQVFRNLTSNALQAMAGGGSLLISEKKIIHTGACGSDCRPEGHFMGISFSDTGEGIPLENMKNLFQPLFSTRSRGIGLGLPICQNLVGANGGWIEVTSRPGEGTTFTVMLPAAGPSKDLTRVNIEGQQEYDT